MSTRAASLTAIVENIEDQEGGERISIDEIVHLIGQVSFAPMLIVPAIALVSPLSGIPFFSSVMGLVIFLVSVQMLFQRNRLWLPKWLLKLGAPRARVRATFVRIHPFVAWLDRRTQTRLSVLTHPPFVIIPQLLCVLSGMVLPVLELVPFSSSLVGLSVTMLGIGLFARDGVILLLAVLPYVLVIGLAAHII